MMKAGKYYVGDPCYVMHGEWDEVCALMFEGRTDHGCNEGEFVLKDGRKFAVLNTAHGDGEYLDQHGRGYCVDAGCIGCVRLEDIDHLNDANNTELGHVIDFDEDFFVYRVKGALHFGPVAIDTDMDSADEGLGEGED